MVTTRSAASTKGLKLAQPNKTATLTANARKVLEKRYQLKRPDGTQETPEEMFRRVAHTIAHAEVAYQGEKNDAGYYEEQFYDLLTSLRFLPNSPTLWGAGVPGSSLSACYVEPIEDSMDGYESITFAVRQAALIMKYGGGVGFDFSKLRPAGTPINSTHGAACGPVRVMQLFNQLSSSFTQGNGAKREGAQMFVLRCDHPDVFEFIAAKDDGHSIPHANISVAITNEFIEALNGRGALSSAADGNTVTEDYSFALRHGGRTIRMIDARDLWQQIADHAWLRGDPGLLFIDRANGDANPINHIYELSGSNPCGEQILGPHENCNLGSIDVAKYVQRGTEDFDWDQLAADVALAVRFLDDVIDVNVMPTEETDRANKLARRIGLGIMGWADALVALRVPYESPQAVDLADRLMGFIRAEADKASIQLGLRRGTYEGFKGSLHERQGTPFRNAFRLSIAPTGSISIIAGTSSGIEPLFALEWTHTMEDGTVLPVKHPAYVQWLALKDAANGEGVHWTTPDYLQTAHDITPEGHVRMQAAFQRHVDNAVSKTINMPHHATVEDVKETYRLAIELGCKGVTVFRDGCRDFQVLTATSADGAEVRPESAAGGVEQLRAGEGAGGVAASVPVRRRLPDTRASLTHKFAVGEQEGYLTVGQYPNGRPGEVFINVSKQGSTIRGLADALAQTLSIALQYGVPIEALTHKLQGSRYEPAGRTINRDIPTATSLTDYLARFLAWQFPVTEGDMVQDALPPPPMGVHAQMHTSMQLSGLTCPDCGNQMHMESGCVTCHSCAYSKCG